MGGVDEGVDEGNWTAMKDAENGEGNKLRCQRQRCLEKVNKKSCKSLEAFQISQN